MCINLIQAAIEAGEFVARPVCAPDTGHLPEHVKEGIERKRELLGASLSAGLTLTAIDSEQGGLQRVELSGQIGLSRLSQLV